MFSKFVKLNLEIWISPKFYGFGLFYLNISNINSIIAAKTL